MAGHFLAVSDAVVADAAAVVVAAAVTDAVSGFSVVVASPFLSVFVVAHAEAAVVVECAVDFLQPAVFVVAAAVVAVVVVKVAAVVVVKGPVVVDSSRFAVVYVLLHVAC